MDRSPITRQAAQALERETIAQHEELDRLHVQLNELEVGHDGQAGHGNDQQRREVVMIQSVA